eukprot:TRINITY_DN1499_c0_g1_i1.p1 TRINITY_DN1499_c0_g1~~TRINITY_DN1499_c0_g1_i1.p1  ORF type:complete len:217 (+),score=58.91 TRINITY_DN1499_c0_g1_i1:27-653(+)
MKVNSINPILRKSRIGSSPVNTMENTDIVHGERTVHQDPSIKELLLTPERPCKDNCEKTLDIVTINKIAVQKKLSPIETAKLRQSGIKSPKRTPTKSNGNSFERNLTPPTHGIVTKSNDSVAKLMKDGFNLQDDDDDVTFNIETESIKVKRKVNKTRNYELKLQHMRSQRNNHSNTSSPGSPCTPTSPVDSFTLPQFQNVSPRVYSKS